MARGLAHAQSISGASLQTRIEFRSDRGIAAGVEQGINQLVRERAIRGHWMASVTTSKTHQSVDRHH